MRAADIPVNGGCAASPCRSLTLSAELLHPLSPPEGQPDGHAVWIRQLGPLGDTQVGRVWMCMGKYTGASVSLCPVRLSAACLALVCSCRSLYPGIMQICTMHVWMTAANC